MLDKVKRAIVLFTKRATHGQKLHVHPCCRLYELCEDQVTNAHL